LVTTGVGVEALELMLVWVLGRMMILATRITTTIRIGRTTQSVSSPFKFFTSYNMAENWKAVKFDKKLLTWYSMGHIHIKNGGVMIAVVLITVFCIWIAGKMFDHYIGGYFVGGIIGVVVGLLLSAVIGSFFHTKSVMIDRQSLSPIVTETYPSGQKVFYVELTDYGKYDVEYTYQLAGGEEKTLIDDGYPEKVVFENTDQPYVIQYQTTLRRNTWIQYVFLTFTPREYDELHVPQGSVYIALGDDQ